MGQGFFNRGEVKTKGQRVASRTGCRASCRLNESCKHPQMKSSGGGEKGILIIAEAPSFKEDKRGEAVAGDATLLLKRSLRKYGIDLERDCRKVYAVACHPPKGRVPTGIEVEACRPMIWKEIKEFEPQLILVLGNTALESVVGHRFYEGLGGIERWRGFHIPDQELNTWTCPTFHPSAVLKEIEWNPAAEVIFNNDIRKALTLLEKPLPVFGDDDACVKIVEGKKLKKLLYDLSRSELDRFAIDYETTGLKPHAKGHQIVTCAISPDPFVSYAFNMPTDPQTLSYFRALMINPVVKKIAANMKFEDMWTRHMLGYQIEGWEWDTMQYAHVDDNRSKITSLKFQSFVQMGVKDYSSHITPYLKGVDEDNANSFNRILEADREAILHYNGLDSLYELRLADIQQRVANTK